MIDRQVIAGAAQRLATFCDSIVDAQVVHGVEPGAIDDLTSPAFHDAAAPVYDLTVTPEFQERIGAVFGLVSVLVDRHRDVDPGSADPFEWRLLHDYYRTAADRLSPRWRHREVDVSELVAVASGRSPSILRFDVLAGLVTLDAATRLAAAARSCIAAVSAPPGSPYDLGADEIERYLGSTLPGPVEPTEGDRPSPRRN